MRILLSTIGSRGEVQPMVALAVQLREMGHEAVLCGPPDFRDWVQSLDVAYVPVGPELQGTAKQPAGPPPTPERRRQMIAGTVAAQFDAVGAAADNCDIIVGGGALAIAAHSIAERRGIEYIYTAFAPVTLPSSRHAPPTYGIPAAGDNDALWADDARRWNALCGAVLNSRRAAVGLPPVADVSAHLYTGAPWLAADPTLAPWPGSSPLHVTQTGAWLLPDDRSLSTELTAFLDAGEPPVYVGFGSVRAPGGMARTAVETARALGRRAVIARGWADLSPPGDEPDCLTIGEVNQQALFRRVAAVVHHGGAGTTTTAARAGAPQVVVPQSYDQFYLADRVDRLGIGAAHPGEPTVESLTAALRRALSPEVTEAAGTIARAVRSDGAEIAARRLTGMRRPARTS